MSNKDWANCGTYELPCGCKAEAKMIVNYEVLDEVRCRAHADADMTFEERRLWSNALCLQLVGAAKGYPKHRFFVLWWHEVEAKVEELR